MTPTSANISVISQPTPDQLAALGVFDWSIWQKEVSEFPWTYDDSETCYFLAGEVTVIPDGGEVVTMGTGDLVTFPAGMSCIWIVKQPVTKHYRFG